MRFPRLSTLAGQPLSVLLLFAALAVLMTWPLAFKISGVLPYGAGDIWQNYWNFWWWKKALLELGQHPYFTPYLYYPHGTDLIFHTHSPFNMLVALPITAGLGPAAAYNFCVLLALTLSGFAGWLLVREITGDGRAGVLGGLVLTFFPNHVEQTLEHLNLFSIQFIPWTIYFLIRVVRKGGWGNTVGLGVTFALNALCSWHLGLLLTLALVPIAVWLLFERARPRLSWFRDAAAAAVISALLIGPFVAPLVREILAGAKYYQKGERNAGIDATFLVTPQVPHPALGSWATQRFIDHGYGAAGFAAYLGVFAVALAALGIARRQPGWRFWLGFTLVSVILALGTHPRWNGRVYEDITLPYVAIKNTPILRVLRVENRFHILTGLGLAVLVGLGWRALSPRRPWAFPAALAVLFLDYLWLPFPLQAVEHPRAYYEMIDGPLLRIGGVLDIPFNQRSRSASHNMTAQTLHERPIAGGYMSTFPPDVLAFVQNEPALADLEAIPTLSRPIDFRRLIQLGLDTVVLHKERTESFRQRMLERIPEEEVFRRRAYGRKGGIPDETMAEIRRQLEEHAGEAAFEDDRVAIFYLNAGAGRPESSLD